MKCKIVKCLLLTTFLYDSFQTVWLFYTDIPIAPKYRKYPQRDACSLSLSLSLLSVPSRSFANFHRALPGAWIKGGAKPNQPPNKEQVSTWSP